QLRALTAGMAAVDATSDDTVDALHRKEGLYDQLLASPGYQHQHLIADAWCAAFMWLKQSDVERPYPITEATFRNLGQDPATCEPWMKAEIARLARHYRFFHWHLEFPDVFRIPHTDRGAENEEMGWDGGFDLMLGNPPWDALSPDTKEFFST